jgi:quercetin dioxygenase-like cupin family protein
MLGGLYEVKVAGEESGGEVSVMEITVPVNGGPPAHRHSGGEVVYVLEGTGRYHVGDRTVDIGPGSVVYIPRGTTETFEPTSTMRVLSIYTPGGIDQFFSEYAEPAPRRELPPAPTSPPDIERLTSIAARYGLELDAPRG